MSKDKTSKNPKELFDSITSNFNKSHEEHYPKGKAHGYHEHQEHQAHENDRANDYKDHYHGQIHYDREGYADKVRKDEFKAKNFFVYSKRNLTFRITASGIILALSVAVSALDILFETFLMFPIGQVYISFRFLDTIVLLIGLPVLGPLFGSLVGFLEPIFHNLIHGMEHGWIQPLTDSLTNIIIIFLTWFMYYWVFRNSPYHRDPNKRKDWIKRLTPGFILAIMGALVATATFFLALYIQEKTGWGLSGHDHHHHDFLLHDDDGKAEVDWDNIVGNVSYFFFAIFGINLLRYFIAYGVFVTIEGRLRPLNHRYR